MIRDEASVSEAIAAATQAIAARREIPFLHFENVWVGLDHGGSDAAYMTAILPDHPQHGTYGWDALKPIDDAVWKEFRARDIERFPYVRFRQEHDLGGVDLMLDDDVDVEQNP